MNITKEQKAIIQSIVNVWETGTPTGDYSNVSIYKDGPGNIRQITYGKSQLTEYGNLKALIQRYILNHGKFALFFKPYLNRIGSAPLVNDTAFIAKLKEAGADPIMQNTQDEIFDEKYWLPANTWFNKYGFTLPLSMLVIYDSYIHSGSVMSFLRNRFSEKTPNNGGDEKKWIEAYLKTRDKWLATHTTRPILRSTVYRTRNMLQAIKEGNWDLSKPFNANGTMIDRAKDWFKGFFKKS